MILYTIEFQFLIGIINLGLLDEKELYEKGFNSS